jgi:hypothetical protein
LLLASLTAKLKKQPIERRDATVFLSFLTSLFSVRECDGNSPFVQLKQLDLSGIEIGTYRAQDVRNTLKILVAPRVRAFRSPGLRQSFNVRQD